MRGRHLGAIALAATLAACATTHPFDSQIEAGRYEDAVRTFEADSTLWSRPDALLFAGRLYADPELPTFDVERAREILYRLAAAFPESAEADGGRPVLWLLGELANAREELGRRTAELESRVALMTDTLTAARGAAERDLQELQATRRRVERLEAELEEARRELERLKAVDLRPRPGPPR